MANDLNDCKFIGRLGQDPEMRYMPSGDAVASFSIACGEQWKDKQGAKQERTEWVNCSAFGKLAEIIGEYLSKGKQVYISGKMKTEKYQAQDGSDRYSTKIIVRDMQMLGSKDDNAQGGQQAPQQGGYQQPQQQQGYGNQPAKQGQGLPQDDAWGETIPF